MPGELGGTELGTRASDGEEEEEGFEELPRPEQVREADTVRILSHSAAGSGSAPCWPLALLLSPQRRAPFAVGPSSSKWIDGDRLTNCPICEVEFGTQHKHITRRHCRRCGGVFCYTCTYDKAALRTWPQGLCLPFTASKTDVHVCSNCYDDCPPPANGLRRCRFCHQRVRARAAFARSAPAAVPIARSAAHARRARTPSPHRPCPLPPPPLPHLPIESLPPP